MGRAVGKEEELFSKPGEREALQEVGSINGELHTGRFSPLALGRRKHSDLWRGEIAPVLAGSEAAALVLS